MTEIKTFQKWTFKVDTYVYEPKNKLRFNHKTWLFPFTSPAGVDVKADERVIPLAEVEVMGRENGVADAAGLLNPKLKPVVDADVVVGAPV